LPKIEINSGVKVLDVPKGTVLIDALNNAGIFVPSACGSTGKCGLCKVKIIKGNYRLDSATIEKIPVEQRDAGLHLSCQVKVNEDIGIEIHPEYLSAQQFKSRLRKKRFLTNDIVELTLEMVSPSSISFKPGQYIVLKSKPYDNNKMVMRPFSIASSTALNSVIQLNIRLNPSGICTPWIFNHLQEGQEVEFNGPRGAFFIRNTLYPMVFIAGGSGIAPVRSILHTMRDYKIDRDGILFFGALTQKDLFYVEEMMELEGRLKGFKYIPALSNELTESDWSGERGLITEVVDRYLRDNISQYEAYLCGKPAMINACISVLEKKKISKENLLFDLFNEARQPVKTKTEISENKTSVQT
jgi:Na+-transporting NADH:ubiquinone oxidoreductase subunit F